MSIQFKFAGLSFGASVDQQTGSLSLFDMIEEIRVPSLPFQLPGFVISLVTEKNQTQDAEMGTLLIHLFTPDGKQISVANGKFGIPAGQKRMKAVFRVGNFPLHVEGKHRFVLFWLNSEEEKQSEIFLEFDAVLISTEETGSGSRLTH